MADAAAIRELFSSDPLQYYFDYCFGETVVPSPKFYDLTRTQEFRMIATAVQNDWCSVNIGDGAGFRRYDYEGELPPPPGVTQLKFFVFRHCRGQGKITVRVTPRAPFVGTLKMSHCPAEGQVYAQITSLGGHHWVSRWYDNDTLHLKDVLAAVRQHLLYNSAVGRKTEIKLVQPCGDPPPDVLFYHAKVCSQRILSKSPGKKRKLTAGLEECDQDAIDGKFGYHIAYIANVDNAETESSDSEDL